MTTLDTSAELAVICLVGIAVVTIGAMLKGEDAKPMLDRWNRQPSKYYRRNGGYVRR